MMGYFPAIFIALGFLLPLPALALDCGAAPVVANSSAETEIDGQAKLLSRYLGDADIKGKYHRSVDDVLNKYPNADRLRINERFMYVMCQSIFSDGALTEAQKREQYIILQEKVMGSQQQSSNPPYPNGKIAAIFQRDMLNSEITYLENITGPARHVNNWDKAQSRDYVVDGCRMTAWAKNGAVLAFSLNLSPKCSFSLGNFVQPQDVSTQDLTIAQYATGPLRGQLRVQSSCISLCGSAADPTVEFTWDGPHGGCPAHC